MDQYARALRFVLYYPITDIYADLRQMAPADAPGVLKEIGKVYEEFLPQLNSIEHIKVVQAVLEITKALLQAANEPAEDSEQLNDLKIDLYNALCDSAPAVVYIRKVNPTYEANYPDLRRQSKEEVIEVPVVKHTELQKNSGDKRIMVNDRDWYNAFNSGEVKYLEARGNYTIFHLRDSSPYTSSKNLGEFEPSLSRDFIRVHRSFIVNMRFIEKVSRTKELLIMKDKTEITVTQNADTLLKRLGES